MLFCFREDFFNWTPRRPFLCQICPSKQGFEGRQGLFSDYCINGAAGCLACWLGARARLNNRLLNYLKSWGLLVLRCGATFADGGGGGLYCYEKSWNVSWIRPLNTTTRLTSYQVEECQK